MSQQGKNAVITALLLLLAGCATAPAYICAPTEHEGRPYLLCQPYVHGGGD